MTQYAADTQSSLPMRVQRFGREAGLMGIVGLAICAVVWILVMILGRRWPEGAAAFYKAYLVAWIFFLGISLGALSAAMVHHLTGGQWGYFVRRFAEAAAGVLPLLLILFVPILFGLRMIYPWADPDNHDAVIAHKAGWMNPAFFILRFLIYFALWIVFAWRLRALSLRRDQIASKAIDASLRRISAVGLVVYFVTMSLAAVDWIMSLEPHWYSTVFGFIVCMGQAVTGVCLCIIMLKLTAQQPPFAPRLRPKHFNDLATLLLTAVILWAYTSFSQLLVIWMGNLQSEIPWYVARSHGPWRLISILLVYLGFLAPFVLLLQRGVKNSGRAMVWTSIGILIMQWLDIFWWITPTGIEPYPSMHWLNVLMNVVALVGIGGVWTAAFLRIANRASLLPGGEGIPVASASSEEEASESRNPDHGAQPGIQPGIA